MRVYPNITISAKHFDRSHCYVYVWQSFTWIALSYNSNISINTCRGKTAVIGVVLSRKWEQSPTDILECIVAIFFGYVLAIKLSYRHFKLTSLKNFLNMRNIYMYINITILVIQYMWIYFWNYCFSILSSLNNDYLKHYFRKIYTSRQKNFFFFKHIILVLLLIRSYCNLQSILSSFF